MLHAREDDRPRPRRAARTVPPPLALQRQIGNRAFAGLVAKRAIARDPKTAEQDWVIHPEAMKFLEDKMRALYEAIPREDRIQLKARGTVAIGMATVDGEPRLVYTVAHNRATKGFHEAAEKLDLHFWRYRSGVKGRGPVGAPNDAEQLMIGFAEDNHAQLHGIVTSRSPCEDCAVVIKGQGGKNLRVAYVPDTAKLPNPRDRPKLPKTVGDAALMVVPLVVGFLHERARAGRVAERAQHKGYVSEGDRGDFIDRAGDVLFDPLGEGERSVPVDARVNVAKWRQGVRALFAGHEPGDTVVFRWDYYSEADGNYSRWYIYVLGDDGRWFIAFAMDTSEAAHLVADRLTPQARAAIAAQHKPLEVYSRETPLDINEVIGTTMTDAHIHHWMTFSTNRA